MMKLKTLIGIALIPLSLLAMLFIFNNAFAAPEKTNPVKPHSQSRALFEPAMDYESVPLIKNCKPRNGARTVYHECRNSRAVYEKAKAAALSKKQPLMLVFGFDECPSCRHLETQIFSKKSPVLTDDFSVLLSDQAIAKAQEKSLKISTVNIHIRNKHGEKLAEELGLVKIANDRGWHRLWSPFIVLLDPETEKLHTEEQWESEEFYCYGALPEIAVSLEELGYLEKGKLTKYRDRCNKKGRVKG